MIAAIVLLQNVADKEAENMKRRRTCQKSCGILPWVERGRHLSAMGIAVEQGETGDR